MRIRYFTDIRFPLDRANGIQSMETCYALAQRGHAITLVVRPDTARPARDPFAFYGLAPLQNFSVQNVPVAGPHVLRRTEYLAAALARAVGGGAADIIFTRDLGLASYLVRIPRSLRPPIVFESHGLAAVSAATLPELLTGAVPGSPRKQRRLRARDAVVWRTAEGYVAITRGLAEDLERHFGFRSPGSLAIVPDGVRPMAQRHFDWRPRPANPVVGYVGHLYPWKGPQLLLQALTALEHVRAIIVGGHPAERDLQDLQHQAHALGLTSRVTFTGYVERSRIADLLAGMDVLVLPHTSTPISERYASPLKLFEYMAAGRPIVASDLASIREVLDDEAAVLVAPGDPATLAAGIRRTLDDWVSAERRARRAYDLVSDYTWDRRAERLDSLLERVASEAHIG